MAEPIDRKAFDRLRLAANDYIRRFKGADAMVDGKVVRVTLTGSEKMVLQEITALVRFDFGYAYPSRDYLANTCDCDLKVVKRAIKKATDLGWYRIDFTGRNNTYRPIWSEMTPKPPEPEADDAGPKKGPAQGGDAEISRSLLGQQPGPKRDRQPVPFCPSAGPFLGPLSLEDNCNTPGGTPLPPKPPAIAVRPAGTSEEEGRTIAPSFDQVFMASGAAGPRGPALAQWNKLSTEDRLAVGSFANANGIDTGGAWFSTWLTARGWEENAPPLVGFTDAKALEDCAKSMERLRRAVAADVIGRADPQWRPIARKLQEQIGGDQLASWFGQVTLRSVTAREIVVEAPTIFHRVEIEKRFHDALVKAARSADPECTVTHARVVIADALKEAAQ